MENKEISTDYSDFASVSSLDEKIQRLEGELVQVNVKVRSLEELLLLAEEALSLCACPALNDQISSLLSRVDSFMSDHSATSSGVRFVDAATQCDGERFRLIQKLRSS